MIKATITTLGNGKIMIHETKKIYSLGRYERRVYLSIQTDRDFADVALTRDNAEELIHHLRHALDEER